MPTIVDSTWMPDDRADLADHLLRGVGDTEAVGVDGVRHDGDQRRCADAQADTREHEAREHEAHLVGERGRDETSHRHDDEHDTRTRRRRSPTRAARYPPPGDTMLFPSGRTTIASDAAATENPNSCSASSGVTMKPPMYAKFTPN